jgi:hypothetical protein
MLLPLISNRFVCKVTKHSYNNQSRLAIVELLRGGAIRLSHQESSVNLLRGEVVRQTLIRCAWRRSHLQAAEEF